MTDVSLFFAFADGALEYSCSTCDQRCCKSGGLALLAGERAALMRMHPALELVAPADRGPVEVFRTPKSGCWFLRRQACGFVPAAEAPQAVAGPRPAACSLFPFNSFALLGEMLVVAPSGLCPLQLAGSPGGGVTHAALAETLARSGAAGELPITLMGAADDDGGAVSRMQLEQTIRDAAGACVASREADLLPLLGFMHLTDLSYLREIAQGNPFDPSRVRLEELERTTDRMDDFMRACARTLQLDTPDLPAPTRESVAALAAALLPCIRLMACDGVALARLAKTLAVLHLYLEHWVALRPQRSVLPQTLMQLANAMLPTAHMMSAWEEPYAGQPVVVDDATGLTLTSGMAPAEVELAPLGGGHRRIVALRRMARGFAIPVSVSTLASASNVLSGASASPTPGLH